MTGHFNDRGYWHNVWRNLKKDRLVLIALIIILILFGVAVFQNFIAGNKPLILKYENKYYFPIISRYKEFFGVNFKNSPLTSLATPVQLVRPITIIML